MKEVDISQRVAQQLTTIHALALLTGNRYSLNYSVSYIDRQLILLAPQPNKFQPNVN